MKFGSWTYSGFKVIFAISLLPFLNWSPQPPPPPPATTTTTRSTLSQHKKQNPYQTLQWDNCVRIAQCYTFPQLDLNQPKGKNSGGLSEYVQNGEWHLRGERHLQHHHDHHHDHHRSPQQRPPFPNNTNKRLGSGIPSSRNEVPFDGEPYLDITFTIQMRRRSLY